MKNCSKCIHAVYDGKKIYCQAIGSYITASSICPKPTSTVNDMTEFIDLPLVSGYKEACMEQVKGAATNMEEVDEVEEVEEQQEKAVNKVVAKALFMSAQQSKDKSKLGITILLYEGIDDATKQVKIALDQKTVKGQSYTVSPVISRWFKKEEITPDLIKFLDKEGLSEVYAIISGNGEFRKIHKFLTVKEYESYMALVG